MWFEQSQYWKKILEVEISGRMQSHASTTVMDGSTVLFVNWPVNGKLEALSENLSKYVEEKLTYRDVYFIFHQFNKLSVKW